MTERLTPERFQALADAYGSVVARWPEVHREAAQRMATEPAARAILTEASLLDQTLDTWRVAAPAAALRNRILTAAPVRTRHFAVRSRLWWSGLGVAAALAGAVAGSAAVAMVAPTDISGGATSFGDVTGVES